MKNLFTKVIGVCCSMIIISVLTATNLQAQYCTASSTNTSDDWLSHVSFAGIENSSGSTTYSDYTSISGLVIPGVSYEFVGTIGLAGSWTQTITVYIDWDQSGTWESSERYTIGSSCSTNGCQLSELIEVPMTALPGETRMRVIEAYSSNNSNPCIGPTYGEVEDYTITVLSGECTPPNFDFEVINDCENENYDVAATLTDFGGSPFITINFTRSDEVTVNPVTLIFALQGQTVNILNNIPFGVTVSASIQGQNPLCNLTRNFAELYCHIDGEVCEAPLVVSELPYTHSGNTSLYLNDYNSTNVPAYAENAIIAGVTGTYYLNGDDVVYAYTPEEDGAIDISAVTGTYGGLWVFTGCPFEVTVGSHLDWDPPASTRKVDHLPVLAGVTYYIVISTWAAPQDTEYTLTITPWEDCEGTPTAGTLGDDMMVCAATGFQLISSDASPDANGLIFTWQSSPVGANTWTDVAGANTPNYNLAAGITEDSDFRLKAYCTATDATTYSDVMTVSINPVYTECYCIATYTYDCNSGDDLSNVSLTGESVALNNTTNCNGGYNDYTDMPAVDLAPGETYTLSASTTYGSPTYEQVKAWIDYNLNGAFEPEELIANTATNGLPGGTDSFVFTVPEGQDPGEYRLRVRLVYGLDMDFDACSDDSFGETEDYMVEIIDLDACAGTPEAGTADNDEMLVCATIPFNISVAGASDPANGLSRIWQSSPAGANTWTDIAGATSANYTLAGGIDIPTDFRYIVECENSGQSDVSNIVEVTLKPATECYCTPSSVYGVDYFISHVTTNNALQDLDKTSGFTTGGYADYSDTDILIAHANQEFDFSIDLGTYTTRVGIWIDLNQNGSFLDEGENIILTPNYVSSLSGSILIPSEMPDGDYRMRIRTVSGTPAPCGLLDYSEAEDYTLQIITLNDCAGTPEAGTVGDDFSVCEGLSFVLNVSGATSPANGLIRNWQSSPAGSNTWSDIPGATSVNYTVGSGIDSPTDFRYRVTCENSSETDYSNVVSVGLNPDTACYCIPTGGANNLDEIINFTLGELSNTSAPSEGTAGYADYTDSIPAVELIPGENYVAQLTSNSGSGDHGAAIWIDYNDNGIFEESEKVTHLPNTIAANATVSFPSFEVLNYPGLHRLRVRYTYLQDGAGLNPCSSTTGFTEVEDYMVNIIILDVCTGTPDGGTASANSSVCANVGFQLSVADASDMAENMTRNWQSSPAGANTWIDIPGATAVNYTVAAGIDSPTDFRYRVTCATSGETAYSNVVSVVLNPGVDCYCTPVYIDNCTWDDLISNVSLTGESVSLNNSTECSSGGYGDYTDLPAADLATGGTYSLSVSTAYSSPIWEEVKAWIDYNENGAFEAGEEIANTAGVGLPGGTSIFEFTVPEGINPGEYRLRVRMVYDDLDFDACNEQYYGETEDYKVQIVESGSSVSLNGSVSWNGNCGERAGVVTLYTPNTATIVETYEISVASDGSFSIPSLPTGTFDIIVKIDGHLAKGIEDVEITAGANTLAVGTIRNGNVNNDNSINVFDLSVINMSFNKAEGQANFNPLADLNCDGSVNIFDISILNASFNKSGAVAPL